MKTATLKGWFLISRVPFLTVGVFPFIAGAVMAAVTCGSFRWGLFWWGTAAVVLIMLATYHNGEYYDEWADTLSGRMERNTFSGGSQAIQTGIIPREHARVGGLLSAAGAMAVGLWIWLRYDTGPWTIPLGLIGLTAGFFYSAPPFRWVTRGIGEIIIGFCYGWLPVAVSFYLQCGRVFPIVHWVSLPIALSIFNVIFINEFPDHPADTIAGKRGLLVRVGKERGAWIYAAAGIGGPLLYLVSVAMGFPALSLILSAPFLVLSVAVSAMMLAGRYRDRKALEIMCALTIVVNWGTTLSYALAAWLRGVPA